VTLGVSLRALSLLFLPGCGLLLDTDPAPAGSGDGSVMASDGAMPAEDGGVLDGEVIADAGADAGPAVRPDLCGGPETLRDDFEDTSVDPLWIPFDTSGGVEVRENGGRLEVRPPSGALAYGGYISKFAVDLRGSFFAVEVPEVAGDAPGLQTYVGLTTFDLASEWLVIHEDGALSFSAGGAVAVAIVYQSDLHRWWRIREGAGQIYFETSPDGIAWTTQHVSGGSAGVGAVQMSVGAGTWAPVDSPGRAQFDGVNLEPPGGERTDFCPVSSLVDDFERTTLGPRWHVSEGGCVIELSAGNARFSGGAGTAGECFLVTTTAYDLRSGSTYAHVEPITDFDSNLSFSLGIQDRNEDAASVTFLNGQLTLVTLGGTSTAPFPTGTGYWRLAHEGDLLGLELSSDAVTWSPAGSAGHFMDLSAVRVGMRMAVATTSAPDYRVVVPSYGTP
jgi:hypothetical protein